MMSHSFQVGDRVRYIRNPWNLGIRYGETGTVCCVDLLFGVEWDDLGAFRHSCDGMCKDQHGWYVSPTDVMLLDDSEEQLCALQALDVENLFV